MLISDSRKVTPNSTFIALRGQENDGHKYILEAIKNGASKIICEEGSFSEVETIVVNNTTTYLKSYLRKNYYPKIKDINLIGITGTNGKTTICYLTYQMLNALGIKTAYIGTIGFYIAGKLIEMTNNTTPAIMDLYDMLLQCKNAQVDTVVMEVSSHSLSMGRVAGLKFDAVAFTNLTQDHLDYHKTMEKYCEAKQKLFKNTRNKKIAVINADDHYADNFVLNTNNNITIGISKGDCQITDFNLSNSSTRFSFLYNNQNYKTEIELIGKYNIYNYLTALILTHKMGFPIEEILNLKIIAPSGRMEKIMFGNNSIFIDYAHTPDAIVNVLTNALEYKKGRIICIVGCGGNRDRTKRPIMGQAATKLSDYVIFTNDNPRFEDPKKIMDDIIEGLDATNYEIIYNRKEAIAKGISLLNNNDILMILGKGHETYQINNDVKEHFSDFEEVDKVISQSKKNTV